MTILYIIGAVVGGVIFIVAKGAAKLIGIAFIIFCAVMMSRKNVQPKTQANTVRYVRSMDSDVFHRPNCKAVKMIDRYNRQIYGSDISAQQLKFAGLKPCSKCKPR